MKDDSPEVEAVDLSTLRSTPARRRLLEDAILASAAGDLARRAAVQVERARRDSTEGPLTFVVRWALPTLAAATVVAALSLAGLALASRDRAAADASPETTLVGALELPEPASTWLVEDRGPATSDLILAVQEDLP